MKKKCFNIGNKQIGGESKILIQSMCNIKTSCISEVINQINDCALLGADMMRVSVKDEQDLKALKEIKANISIPLIADIHFIESFALEAIKAGVDAIRINPLNIDIVSFENIVLTAKEYDCAIRIGFNSGSKIGFNSSNFIDLVKQYIKVCEDNNFSKIVLSYKDSNILNTIKYNELLANSFEYPIHIGLTEAGTIENSLIKSSSALSSLLLKGIGDTLRISITDDPKKEVIAARKLLGCLGIQKVPDVISCPTCGRTEVEIKELAMQIEEYLFKNNKDITVAVMGCVVNGPGEASKADIGIAGGNNEFAIFTKGKIIKKVPQQEAYKALIEEINKL